MALTNVIPLKRVKARLSLPTAGQFWHLLLVKSRHYEDEINLTYFRSLLLDGLTQFWKYPFPLITKGIWSSISDADNHISSDNSPSS